MKYGRLLVASLVTMLFLAGCATTGQMDLATTMDILPDGNGQMVVKVWEGDSLVDEFDSGTHIMVLVDQESTKREKVVYFLKPDHFDPAARSCHVSAKLFTQLGRYFQVEPFSEMVRLAQKE